MQPKKVLSTIDPTITICYYGNGWFLEKSGKADSPLNLIQDPFKRLQVMAEANDLQDPINYGKCIFAELTALFTGEKKIIKTDCKSRLSFVNLYQSAATLEQLAASSIKIIDIK